MLNRKTISPKYTEGELFINGIKYCDTLEDAEREIKIPGETCIPLGRYQIIMNMSTRFKKIMPLLLNVNGYNGVRIHAGNSINDTEGCILTGIKTSDGTIGKSKQTTDVLYAKITAAINNKEKVFIEIRHEI